MFGGDDGQLSSLSNISNHFMQAIFWGIYEKKKGGENSGEAAQFLCF
jgi:hypothetical protein